jgi:hypothetical protein
MPETEEPQQEGLFAVDQPQSAEATEPDTDDQPLSAEELAELDAEILERMYREEDERREAGFEDDQPLDADEETAAAEPDAEEPAVDAATTAAQPEASNIEPVPTASASTSEADAQDAEPDEEVGQQAQVTADGSVPQLTPEPSAAPEPGSETDDDVEFPLWTGPENAAFTSTEANVFEAFGPVAEAWTDTMPPEAGTADDLRQALEQELRTLQEALHRAIPSSVAAAAEDGPQPQADERGREPKAAAAAVNTAVREADTHAATLRPLVEWREIQTQRNAVQHLWHKLKAKAGPWSKQFLADARVQGFWRTVSIRVCEKIAGWAQAGADSLRRDGGDGPGVPAVLPSAEALLKLSDAAIAYSSPSATHDGHLAELRQLRTELAAVAKSGNDRPAGLAAAANARSVSTSASAPSRGSTTAGEQAAHLRRPSADRHHGSGPSR